MSSRVQPMLPRLPATPGKRVFGTAAAVDGMSRRADSSSPGVPILRGASSLIPRFLLLLLLLLLLHSVLFPRRRKKKARLCPSRRTFVRFLSAVPWLQLRHCFLAPGYIYAALPVFLPFGLCGGPCLGGRGTEKKQEAASILECSPWRVFRTGAILSILG